jgi:hypothetical protein
MGAARSLNRRQGKRQKIDALIRTLNPDGHILIRPHALRAPSLNKKLAAMKAALKWYGKIGLAGIPVYVDASAGQPSGNNRGSQSTNHEWIVHGNVD